MFREQIASVDSKEHDKAHNNLQNKCHNSHNTPISRLFSVIEIVRVCVSPETRIDNTEYHMMCQSQHEGAVTLSPCVRHCNNCAIDCNLPSSSGLDSERRHDLKGVNPEPKGEGREMYC